MAKKLKGRLVSTIIGAALIAIALISTQSSSIPFLGAVLLAIAPDFLLAGLVSLVIGILGTRKASRTITFAAVALFILGLNTRIPSVLKDLARTRTEDISGSIRAPVGAWVRVESEMSSIDGRTFLYSTARRRCSDDGCFTSNGYRMPAVGITGEYWSEPVRESVIAAGLSLSGRGNAVATIRIKGKLLSDHTNVVEVSILDSSGAEVGRLIEYHRVGFPYESVDGTDDVSLAEYLIHSNFVSRLVARWFWYDDPYPVSRLISKVFAIEETQRTPSNIVELVIDVAHPTPATLHTDSDDWSKVSLPYRFPALSDTCHNKFHIQQATHREIPEYTRDVPTGTFHGWWPFEKNIIPIKFVKDESGGLVVFGDNVESRVIFTCDEETIYAITDNLEPYVGHMFRLVTFDNNGVAITRLEAKVSDPMGEWSRLELPSIRVSRSHLEFNRWYMPVGSTKLLRRQVIKITLAER
jgi:hypothetical protein